MSQSHAISGPRGRGLTPTPTTTTSAATTNEAVTTVDVRGLFGTGKESLPRADVSSGFVRYAAAWEIGGGVRWLAFADAAVIAASPILAWDRGGLLRLDGRYSYSRTKFDTTGESAGDHSVFARETWRLWPRVWLNAAYAYGIESFEQLSADRIGSLGATTVALGAKINLPPLTVVTAAWEHQWQSNDTKIDRLTLSVLQTFK